MPSTTSPTAASVLVHDCDPPTPREQPRPTPGDAAGGPWCGEVWKTIVTLRATRPDLSVEVIDADLGIGVIRRRPSPTLEIEAGALDQMTFDDLVADRVRLLGIRD